MIAGLGVTHVFAWFGVAIAFTLIFVGGFAVGWLFARR